MNSLNCMCVCVWGGGVFCYLKYVFLPNIDGLFLPLIYQGDEMVLLYMAGADSKQLGLCHFSPPSTG